MIQFERISKIYHSGTNKYPVLQDVSFEIQKGEYVVITGKSGSGKSTLLNMLTGVDTATSGTILVNGINILQLGEAKMTIWRGENAGIIFQFFQLIPNLSALENILLPMDLVGTIPQQNRGIKALELLNMVELADYAHKMPSALSGGEQQRVAIARALANNVDLIIADEPTGNLDSQNAELIFGILHKLNLAGKTIVMVTHEKESILGASRKITLKDGKIIKDTMISKGGRPA